MKSTQNLIKANVSTKTIQFDECRRGGYDPRFHEIQGHSPLPAPPKTEEFLLKHLILGGFHVKSAGFHECELLRHDQV